MNRASLLTLLFSGALVVACSSSSTATGSPDGACRAYFDELFSSSARCGTGITVPPAQEAAARARFTTLCEKALAAPGQGVTTAYLSQCVDKLKAAPCGSDFDDVCAQPAGTLDDGVACGDDSQCKSTECKKADGSECGTCAPRLAIGQPCNPSESACAQGARCATKDGKTGTCEAAPKLNEGDVCYDPAAPSSSPASCASGLRCKIGGATEPAKCTPRSPAGADCTSSSDCLTELSCVDKKCATPPGEGAACTLSTRCAKGLACDAAQKKCVAIIYVKAGEACDSSARRCERGSCKRDADTTTGTCIDPIADGAACGAPGDQARCDIFAECIAGTCQLPDAAQCK